MKEIIALLTIITGFLLWAFKTRLDLKIGIFKETIKALSLFEVDIGNQKLQNQNYRRGEKDRRYYPFLRDETLESIGRCSGLVNAFYSQEVSNSFDNAI